MEDADNFAGFAMSFRSRLTSFVLVAGIAFGVGSACTGAQSPSLRVLGVRDTPSHEVVFVQVTNPASRPMRLTKLEYAFAAQGTTLSTGSLPLSRDVPANSTVVVEVPLAPEAEGAGAVTLRGQLTATVDQIVKSFAVSAQLTGT